MPSSISPRPVEVAPWFGTFHAIGTTMWNWVFGAMPRLYSIAGPLIALAPSA